MFASVLSRGRPTGYTNRHRVRHRWLSLSGQPLLMRFLIGIPRPFAKQSALARYELFRRFRAVSLAGPHSIHILRILRPQGVRPAMPLRSVVSSI